MSREHELARWFADRDESTAAPLRAEIERLRAEIERLRADRTKLIALLAEARGPEGHTEERVVEWLRGRGYTCIHKP